MNNNKRNEIIGKIKGTINNYNTYRTHFNHIINEPPSENRLYCIEKLSYTLKAYKKTLNQYYRELSLFDKYNHN